MEDGEYIRKSEGNVISSPSPLGRLMNTLLGSRPRQLEAAISRIGSASSRSNSGVLLDESLCYLRRYVKDAVEKGDPLDQVLVPMIEHSLKFRGPKHCKHVWRIISWIFQDELLFQAFSSTLAAIIMMKEDHFIAFGWCTLVSSLIELTIDEGIQEKHISLVKILSQSLSSLLPIVCKGSTLQGEYELPTRLSVAAADCTLLLTGALSEVANCRRRLSVSKSGNHIVMSALSNSKKQHEFRWGYSQGLEDTEMERLLWDHLDELIVLVQKLQAWSTKSRSLHSKGLERVMQWLQEIKRQHCYIQDESGDKLLKSGMSLLCSCWKHYAALMRLEDHSFSKRHRDLLEQYISAIQLYTRNENDDVGRSDSNIETRIFFVNCLSLLYGRLDDKQLEIVISEHGQPLLNLLLLQLEYDDKDLAEGSLIILRAIIFKANISSGSSHVDTNKMDAVLPLLLTFLDERGSIAKAVALLFAEYCFVNPGSQGLQELFKRLGFGNLYQKKNAIDVISELVHLCLDSENILSSSLRQEIAEHLLECLGNEEVMNHVQESNLLPHFDPHFVLPALVQFVYSENEKVRFSASDALVAVLRFHNQNISVILTLLDCLSNLSGNSGLANKEVGMGESLHASSMLHHIGEKPDVDWVLRLIPKWAKSVENWSLVIEQIINKMFQDPSNAIIVRFMSYIRDQLVEAKDLVLYRVLLHMQAQHEMDRSWLLDTNGTFSSKNIAEVKGSLFDRLSPLLLLRVLPLRVFDELHSSTLYNNLHETLKATSDIYIKDHDCIAAHLINRAFSMFEFEDVRKLAAELCGRLHPQVLLPVIESQLKHATQWRDIMKMRACLFALCTSLVARNKHSALHPVMSRIRKILEMILSWPSLDADEVSKAQHGCIDCLALMICAEVNAPESSKDFASNRISIVEDKCCPGDCASSSVLNYVIQKLTCDKDCDILTGPGETACCKDSCSDDRSQDTSPSTSEALSNLSTSIPFRLCMANVLISACQKVSSSGKQLFASSLLPSLICSVEAIACSDVRAACLQVLFSAVYHLKSSVLPFASDLLILSVEALKNGSVKEKLAAVKLMASLMASEDEIIGSITGGLLEAKLALENVASMESSLELQQLCRKLLVCVTSPIDDTAGFLIR